MNTTQKVYLLDDDEQMHKRVHDCFIESTKFDLEYTFSNHLNLFEQLKKDKEEDTLPFAIVFDRTLTEDSQGGIRTNGYNIANQIFNLYPEIKRLIYTADMYESREIEKAIRSNMNGLLIRNNLESHLIFCLEKVELSKENYNVFNPALSKGITIEKYLTTLARINKNLDIKAQFENSGISWNIFLYLAKGYSSKRIEQEGLYIGVGFRGIKSYIRAQINALISADKDKQRWSFLLDIVDKNNVDIKQIDDGHFPIIAIILKVKEIEDWYKDSFGINFHY